MTDDLQPDVEAPSSHHELPIRFNRLAVAGGLAVYAGALVFVARRWEFPPIGVVAVLLITLALVAEFVAKGLFGALFRDGLIRQGHMVTIRVAVSAAFIGTAVARLVPAGGALSPTAMAWAVRSEDRHAAGAALWTTLTSYGGLLLLSGAAFGWAMLAGGDAALSFGSLLLVVTLVGVGLAAILGIRWLGWLVAVLPRSLGRYFGPTAGAGPVTIRQAVLIGARVALEAMALWLVLVAFDIALSPGQTMLTFGTAKVVASLPLTPGGIGLVEGSMVGVLTALGFQSDQVLGPVLIYQIVDYWAVAAVGVYAAGRLSRRRIRPR